MDYNLRDMAKQVDTLKKTTLKLKEMGGGIPAVEKNSERLLASIKMLELNINDLVEVYTTGRPARKKSR